MFKQKLYIISGCILCVFGMIGIFVPILPTTPFLLAGALLFARSSPQLYRKLCTNEYLGSFIKNYREHCGVPYETIHKAMLFLWLTVAVSVYFTGQPWQKLILFAVGCGVSLHLLSLKKSNRKPLNFTMIELLVSIGAITILCSILLGVFNRARSAGAKTLCMNNLRQISMALHLYSFEYEDFIPPLANKMHGSCMVVKMNNSPLGLGHLIGNYGTSPRNYGCPLNPQNLPYNVARSWQNSSNAQNAYLYRFDDQDFNPILSHPENSKRSFLIDFCCISNSKNIIAHNFEDINCAYVDGSVRRHKNSPAPNHLFTLTMTISNGQMQTSSAAAWQNADSF